MYILRTVTMNIEIEHHSYQFSFQYALEQAEL